MLTDRRKAPICRSWWTKARVLAGLRQLHADTGESPLSEAQYRELTSSSDHGLRGARRRYPAVGAVRRGWPSFAAAWREAGVEIKGKLLWSSPAGMEGVPWARLREEGERYGRLVIVEFAGYRQQQHARLTTWRCRCDCGRECIVAAGRFKSKRECRRCARAGSIARRKAEAAQRAATQVQMSMPAATASLAGATGAPRATSLGKASGGGRAGTVSSPPAHQLQESA